MLFPVDRLNGGAYNVDASANQFFLSEYTFYEAPKQLTISDKGYNPWLLGEPTFAEIVFLICALLLREKLATEKMENEKKMGKKREDNGESTIPLTSLPVHCLNSSTCNTDTFAKKTKMAIED